MTAIETDRNLSAFSIRQHRSCAGARSTQKQILRRQVPQNDTRGLITPRLFSSRIRPGDFAGDKALRDVTGF